MKQISREPAGPGGTPAVTPQQLGQSLFRLGRQFLLRQHFEEARESFALSLEFEPESAETCFELGNLLHATGRNSEAAAYYGRALALSPGFAEAWHNMGVVQMLLRDFAKARICFENAIGVAPGYAEAHNNLAILMQAAGQVDEALEHYRQAAAIRPDFAEPQYNLALTLQERQQFEECAQAYRKLLQTQPRHVDARNNLANVLLELGSPAEALREYESVVKLDPKHPEAHWNLGLVQLQLGQWRAGWKNYEWRFRQPGSANSLESEMLLPRWDGRDLKGKRILLAAEQGLGDMLQFLRLVPEVVARGGKVIVECHGPLRQIVSRIPGVAETVVKGDPRPDHDCWAPLLSLPAILGWEAPPGMGRKGYVRPDPARLSRWRRFVKEAAGGRPRRVSVGLVWSGNTQFKANAKRAIPPDAIRKLTAGRTEAAVFFGLQKGVPWIEGAGLIDPQDDPSTLEDMAALVRSMDLLITVDTSIAHLGGALGQSTWTMLSHAADWRWMTDRGDSLWYPSMRLFRQPKRGDWDSVIAEVGHELDRFLAQKRGLLN